MAARNREVMEPALNHNVTGSPNKETGAGRVTLKFGGKYLALLNE